MILFRRSRLGTVVRTWALLGLSALILMYTPNAGYGLSQSDPVEINNPASTEALETSLNSFVSITGFPDNALGVIHRRYGILYYWVPLQGSSGKVLIRTPLLDQSTEEHPDSALEKYQGKLTQLGRVAFSKDIKSLFASQFGIDLSDETYAILQDEEPSAYRFVAVVYFALISLWFLLVSYMSLPLFRSKGRK